MRGFGQICGERDFRFGAQAAIAIQSDRRGLREPNASTPLFGRLNANAKLDQTAELAVGKPIGHPYSIVRRRPMPPENIEWEVEKRLSEIRRDEAAEAKQSKASTAA
ncbi:hypothetical protein RPC_1723 [Rhodopseudomonas palustris BisB18]|uniref:Uncharacterized protein n=1 Tax=Rhodopseudomonas palustris (strain BisB18) TaxID=316056 RepID=Q218A4_RHOPB